MNWLYLFISTPFKAPCSRFCFNLMSSVKRLLSARITMIFSEFPECGHDWAEAVCRLEEYQTTSCTQPVSESILRPSKQLQEKQLRDTDTAAKVSPRTSFTLYKICRASHTCGVWRTSRWHDRCHHSRGWDSWGGNTHRQRQPSSTSTVLQRAWIPHTPERSTPEKTLISVFKFDCFHRCRPAL